MKADSKYSWGDFSDILAAVNRGIDSVMKDVRPRWFEDPPADESVRFELTENGLSKLLFGKLECDWRWENGVLKPDGLPTKIIKAKQLHLFYKEKDSIADEVTQRYKLTNRDGGEIEDTSTKQAAFYTLNNCFDEINERVFCELKKLFQERLNMEVLQSVKYEKEIIAFLLALELEQRPKVHSTADFYNENHFIGRDEEMERAKTFVTDSEKKTLVLSGPGMVGKSYLMEEIVRKIETDDSDWVMRWNNPLKTNNSIWEMLAELFGETVMRKILSKYYSVCVCVEGNADSPDALMSEIDRIHKDCDCKLIITTRLDIKETDDIEVIKLQPLTEEALKKLFLSYVSENACLGFADQIVSSVSGNALLMWLIADACSRYEEREAINQIRCLLNMMLAQQQFYQKKSLDVYLTELKEIEYSTILSANGHVLEHLRRAFTQYFPDEYQILLQMLSCLSGMTIPRSYLERWFNCQKPESDEQKTGIVEPLIRLGWIRENDDRNVVIQIPRIIAINMMTKGEDKKSYQKLAPYVEHFCTELTNAPENQYENGKLGEMIFCLHNYLVNRMNLSSASDNKKLSYRFHIIGVLYFIKQSMPKEARRLLEQEEDILKKNTSKVTIELCVNWSKMIGENGQKADFDVFYKAILEIEENVLKKVEKNVSNFIPEELEVISEFLAFCVERWADSWMQLSSMPLDSNAVLNTVILAQTYQVLKNYIYLHELIERQERCKSAPLNGADDMAHFAYLDSFLPVGYNINLADLKDVEEMCVHLHDLKQPLQELYRKIQKLRMEYQMGSDRMDRNRLREEIMRFQYLLQWYRVKTDWFPVKDLGYNLLTYKNQENRWCVSTLDEALQDCQQYMQLISNHESGSVTTDM